MHRRGSHAAPVLSSGGNWVRPAFSTVSGPSAVPAAQELDSIAGGLLEPVSLDTHTELGTDGRVVLYAQGDIDVATAPALQAALAKALEQSTSVVVDVGAVGFVDSAGLSALVWGHRQAALAVASSPAGNHRARHVFPDRRRGCPLRSDAIEPPRPRSENRAGCLPR